MLPPLEASAAFPRGILRVSEPACCLPDPEKAFWRPKIITSGFWLETRSDYFQPPEDHRRLSDGREGSLPREAVGMQHDILGHLPPLTAPRYASDFSTHQEIRKEPSLEGSTACRYFPSEPAMLLWCMVVKSETV